MKENLVMKVMRLNWSMKKNIKYLILNTLVIGILWGLAIEITVQWFTNTILIMGFMDFMLLLVSGVYLVILSIKLEKNA